jgi:hypothetical protein
MRKELINLTPHEVLIEEDSEEIKFEEGKKTTRILYEQEFDHNVDDIAIYHNVTGWIKGLPPQRDGIGYIVSGIVFNSVFREDLYTPNTSPWSVKRRGFGKVVSVRSLLCHPRKVA